MKSSPPNQAQPFSSTSFSLIISQRNDTRSTECAQSRSICTEEADTRPIESERHKIRKKNPDKEVIHGQPVEEVAMDTAGPERSEMSRGHEEKSIWSQAGDKEENCRVTKEASQLLSTYTCVCVFPVSFYVDGVLLPLLAAEPMEALGMKMSKDGSGSCCCVKSQQGRDKNIQE